MITVIASIQVDIDRIVEFVEIFNSNVPAVLEEEGCIEYYPTVDIEAGLDNQDADPSIVTIVECWESIESLKKHLDAPHMITFRDTTKDIVKNVAIKVLQSV